MRIALVSMHTSPGATPGSGDAGGMNVVVAEAARALSSRGHEVVAFTRASEGLAPGERALDPEHPDGAALVAIEAGEPALLKGELPRVLPEFARGVLRYDAGRPFDAVHGHYWLSGVAALPLAARDGLLPAVTLHTVAAQKNAALAPGDRPEPPLRLAAERALARRAFVVAGSRSELTAIEAGCGAPAIGAEVIHPGVDTALFRPRARPGTAPVHGAEEEPLRITVLGRVQPLKGQDLAVRAFVELAARDPELAARCELVVAGEPTPGDGGYAASLRRIADDGGVADRVRFLPSVERPAVAELLAASDVVLVPSRAETFGLVALEAAAAGAPAAVAAHTGLLEAAPEGTSAVHVEDRDPASWAEAMRGLLRDAAHRARLGAAAREHALAHDWSAHAAALERVYARLRRPDG